MKQPSVLQTIKMASIASLMSIGMMANAANDQTKSEEILSEETSPSEMREQMQKEMQQENVETIEVVGTKPLLFYKRQVELAELDFYDLFNAIADEDKFKVKCRKEARAGSRIKTTVCYPQYVLSRMAQETQDAISSGLPYPKLDDIEFLVQREKEESMKYVEEIVTQNPKLLAKLIEMNEKQALYQSKKDVK